MNALFVVSIAAGNGHIDALECLLDNCADDIINGEKKKQPPLHYACFYGEIDAARYIIEKYPYTVHLKASENAKHCTSLHVAAKSGNVACIKVLLQHGADIDAADADGATAFTYAAHYGNLATVQFLHDRGVSAIGANRKGWLLLHYACLARHVDVTRFLLQKHSNSVNSTTTDWYDP